ncbi:MAG: glycosyltransferase [Bryobacteraceae bacterium]|nr:glycosyltransferase [Bryobacteraceae bacterium]
MSFPSELMRDIGGLDPQFHIASEDRDLSERWRMAGHRMVFEPRAIVQHSHQLTLGSFCRMQTGETGCSLPGVSPVACRP